MGETGDNPISVFFFCFFVWSINSLGISLFIILLVFIYFLFVVNILLFSILLNLFFPSTIWFIWLVGAFKIFNPSILDNHLAYQVGTSCIPEEDYPKHSHLFGLSSHFFVEFEIWFYLIILIVYFFLRLIALIKKF